MKRKSAGETRPQVQRGFGVWLSEQLARTGSFSAAASLGSGKAPSAGVGQRTSMERVHLPPDYRFGAGWQSLALGGIVIVLSFVTLVPASFLDRILNGPPRLAVSRPDVLVVSGHPSDSTAVAQAAQPRGYHVRVAASVESGLEKLRQDPSRIGFVVIDRNLAGAARVIGAVKTSCPEARLILLDGPRETSRISNLLVDAGMD